MLAGKSQANGSQARSFKFESAAESTGTAIDSHGSSNAKAECYVTCHLVDSHEAAVGRTALPEDLGGEL